MKLNIITPFYRFHLVTTLIHYLEPYSNDLIWYPVIATNEVANLAKEPLETIFNRSWIHPIIVKEFNAPPEHSYRKLNDFADTHEIIDDDYYCFMCDDNMYEPEFFSIIKTMTSKVVIISAVRGDTLPSDPNTIHHHLTSTLKIGTPEHIVAGSIDLCQIIIKGEVYKKHRFDITTVLGDGFFAEEMKRTYPQDLTILTETYAFFNYFQPGRYTKKEALLKPNWDLPIFY